MPRRELNALQTANAVACDFVFVTDALKDKVRGKSLDSATRASDHPPVAAGLA